MESRRNGPQLSSRHDDDDDQGSNPWSRQYSIGYQPWASFFTHIASPVSQLQETGVQKGVFGA